MASYDNIPAASGLSIGKAFGLFARAFAALADWNDARITRAELSKLSARELDDIGLTPGDIEKFGR